MIKTKAKLTCRITLRVKTKDLSPLATFDGSLPIGITTQSINDFSMAGDRAYEIPPLEVYPPISPVGLGASLPRPNTPRCLNEQTLISTLGIRISLFTDLTEGRSIQFLGNPYLSISDTQQDHANVGHTLPCI